MQTLWQSDAGGSCFNAMMHLLCMSVGIRSYTALGATPWLQRHCMCCTLLACNSYHFAHFYVQQPQHG